MFANATSLNSSTEIDRKRAIDRTLLAIVLIVIIVGEGVLVATAQMIGPAVSVTSKNFTPYSTPVSQNKTSPPSLDIIDTNGAITVSSWSYPYLVISGTITARGIGANPDSVSFIESNSTGDIIFEPILPPATVFFFTSYTVDITVYTPHSAQFGVARVVVVNGNIQASKINASTVILLVTNGRLSASDITTSNLMLNDTKGDIGLTCSSSCASVSATATNGAIVANMTSLSLNGPYALGATNGNINLTLSKSSGFGITATATGTVSSSGITVSNGQPLRYDGGTAVITLTAIEGSISVAVV